MSRPVCRVCGTPGAACGADHMNLPPITSATMRGDTMSQPGGERQQLKEYEYYVGHMLLTAQLTEAQAEKMGAKPAGQAEAPQVGAVPNKEAERIASNQAAADANGVDGDDPEALNKARDTRNRRPR